MDIGTKVSNERFGEGQVEEVLGKGGAIVRFESGTLLSLEAKEITVVE